MHIPLKTDFIVGIICESSQWKKVEVLFEGREDIRLVHIHSIESTYARGFSFVIDLFKNDTLSVDNYEKILREIKYRQIPVLIILIYC